MNTKYTHLELGKDESALAGYYTPHKEVRLKYDGREVLYVVGEVVIESSCCATGSWEYAIVPGYIVNWQKEKNKSGQPVSEVELIADKETQDNIKQLIETEESVYQVSFW